MSKKRKRKSRGRKLSRGELKETIAAQDEYTDRLSREVNRQRQRIADLESEVLVLNHSLENATGQRNLLDKTKVELYEETIRLGDQLEAVQKAREIWAQCTQEVYRANDRYKQRVADLEHELEAANITIENIRDNLFELITGRIADWLNSQGDTFSCSHLPIAEKD